MSPKCHSITDKILQLVYFTTNAHCYLDIYLQAEEAPIVSCSDSRRGLEPFAGFPKQVVQRLDR